MCVGIPKYGMFLRYIKCVLCVCMVGGEGIMLDKVPNVCKLYIVCILFVSLVRRSYHNRSIIIERNSEGVA